MDSPPLFPGKLICLVCARMADCPPEDQVRYMQAREWPRCCGQVMAFYPHPDEPDRLAPE